MGGMWVECGYVCWRLGLTCALRPPEPFAPPSPRPFLQALVAREQSQGCTVVVLSVSGHPSALLGLRDTVKPEAAAVVAQLRRLGMECWMVTGDCARVAAVVAREVSHILLQPSLGPRCMWGGSVQKLLRKDSRAYQQEPLRSHASSNISNITITNITNTSNNNNNNKKKKKTAIHSI